MVQTRTIDLVRVAITLAIVGWITFHLLLRQPWSAATGELLIGLALVAAAVFDMRSWATRCFFGVGGAVIAAAGAARLVAGG